jgi:cobalamin biosynthesis protein CobW
VFADQLACADLAILNKTDLVDPEPLAVLYRDLAARLRPGTGLVTARHGRVPPAVALGLAAAAEDDLAARPTLHDLETGHDHDDFESFVVIRDPVTDAAAFGARLRSVARAHGVLRIKGFVALPGRERRQVVQAVGDRLDCYFDRSWAKGEPRRTRLIVIGMKGLDRSAIGAALAC